MAEFPIELKMSFRGSLWQHWELRFSQRLEELWQRLEELRTRQPDYNNPETYRRQTFLAIKAQIREAWGKTADRIKEQQDRELAHQIHTGEAPRIHRTFNNDIYYSAIHVYYDDYFLNHEGGLHYNLRSLRIDFDGKLEEETPILRELQDDERLEELWNQFGSHKLSKVKFVWAE